MRPSIAEWVGVLGLLAVLVGVYVWGARYGIDPFEEGYFAYLSSRVAVGDLPYRDFATPYTPAYFFLHGLLYQLLGWTLVSQRLGVIAARFVGAALLYVLARRVAPPRYAVLAPLLLLLHDPAPVPWHTHPSWYASAAALASAWTVLRFLDVRRLRWLMVAGALAGLSFAFKQNIGLLALLAAGSFLALAVGPLPLSFALPGWAGSIDDTRLARISASLIRPLAAVGLPLAFAIALRGRLQLEYILEFIGPLLILNLWLLRRRPPEHVGLLARLAPLVALMLGFVAITVPWLVVLIVSIGRGQTPLRQFVGGVDPEGYVVDQWWPHPEGLLVLAFAPVALFAWRSWHRGHRGRSLLTVIVWAALAGWAVSLVVSPYESPHRAAGSALTLFTENLNQMLPALGVWLAVWGIMRGWGRVEAVLPLAWLVSYGAALYFLQYPRMDEPHLIFSVPPMAIGAAWVLGALDAHLRGGLAPAVGWMGRAALTGGLLALPLLSTWPVSNWRWTSLVVDRADRPYPGPASYAPVQIERAGVLAPPYVAEPLTSLIRAIEQRTAPGEPIFAFPAIPMVYYLADRPNATRFNHFLPGLASAAEEADSIRALDQRDVRLVVIEPSFEASWLRESDYRPLRDTLRERFRHAQTIGPYEIWIREEYPPAARAAAGVVAAPLSPKTAARAPSV